MRLSSSGRSMPSMKVRRTLASTVSSKSSAGVSYGIGLVLPSACFSSVPRFEVKTIMVSREVRPCSPRAVGEPAVLEDLQELVQDARMRLLDLVEEQQAERLVAHRVGQFAAGLVPM